MSARVTSIVPPAVKLLIVEDEPSLRQMLEILFRREGYAVVSAPGYRAAVEAIAQHPQPFPVILTDLSMPDGSGLDLVPAAKSRSPASEVILITAHSTVENAILAMRSGAYDFVAKPFDPSELAALVAKALEKGALVNENLRLRARVERDRASKRARGTKPRAASNSSTSSSASPTRGRRCSSRAKAEPARSASRARFIFAPIARAARFSSSTAARFPKT